MQTKTHLFVWIAVVVMWIVGCTTAPKETAPKEKETTKTYPFLGTEWQLVSYDFVGGSMIFSSEDFVTYTFSETTWVVRFYEDKVLDAEYSTNLLEYTSTTISFADSEDDTQTGATYVGVSKVWYTVSGDTMKFTNWVFVGTNQSDPNDITTMIFLGAGSPGVSQTFKAR
ncbi:MAG: hypothetical protein N2314_05420 [Brevinematales bacterium]|nr:hypothetical protein [Brevinematales bacterium]